MAVKAQGPIADEYRRLSAQVKEVLHDSNMYLHITNLGHLLGSRGLIKNPRKLYNLIENDLIRILIDAKIREK